VVSAVTWMAVTAIIFAAWVSEIDLPSSKPRSRHRESWAVHVSRRARRGRPGCLGLGVCRSEPWEPLGPSWVVHPARVSRKQGPPIKDPASVYPGLTRTEVGPRPGYLFRVVRRGRAACYSVD
jgi:hypothetical protein